MNKTDQITRIKRMEINLNEAAAAIKALSEAMEAYAAVQPKLRELAAYYGSSDWLADCDADARGELPQDLKRGVLSQDAVYDLLAENDRLRDTLGRIETSADI